MELKNEVSTTPNENCGLTATDTDSALKKFEFWLRDLAGCASYKIFSCMGVDHSNHDIMACDYDNAFSTKGKCRQAAEARMEKAYHEAEQKMDSQIRTFEKSSVYHAFQNDFDKRLNTLRNYLCQLRNAQTACVVDQMVAYFVASKIHEAAIRISEQLYADYRLQGLGSYTSGIRYITDDPSRFEEGIAKLFAKAFIHYGYDCFDAICSLETDMRDRLEGFQTSFNAQIQEVVLSSVVEPILALLPQLSDAINLPAV